MSDAPRIDATNAEDVYKELFDDDRWVKDKFRELVPEALKTFADCFAAAFKDFPELDKLAEKNEQTAFVAGFVFGVFDDVLVSTKLFVTGKLMASGNLMRQAIEGFALAMLCSSPELLVLPMKKGKAQRIRYWEHVKKDDPRVRSHRALDHLELNASTLGLSIDGVRSLKRIRSHFHQFSHPGLMGIAQRLDLGEPGPIFLGGGFDKSKRDGYAKEMEHRIGLCKALPNLLKGLMDSLK